MANYQIITRVLHFICFSDTMIMSKFLLRSARLSTGVDFMLIYSLISALMAIFIILAEHFGLYEKVKPYIKYVKLGERCIFVIISLVIFFKN